MNPNRASAINSGMRTQLLIAIVVLLISACKECPQCPPGCPDPATRVEPLADAGTPGDAAVQESDASVPSETLGGKPTPPEDFELHGRAGFDKVSIWTEPDMESPRLGYFRKGQRTRVGDIKYATENCPKGWFQLKEGGFVCQGRGMLVGTKPRFIPRPPPKPRVDSLDPYRHGFIRHDWTPAYKRVPSVEEMWELPEREVVDTENPQPVEDGVDAGPPPMETVPHCTPELEEAEEECLDYHRLAKRKFKAVRKLLSRGFWVSIANRQRDDATGEYYYQTIEGDVVPGNSVHLVKPPTFHGYEVLGDSPLPGAVVRSRNAAFYEMRNGKFRGVGPVTRLSVYRVLGESEGKGIKFYKIEGDRWLKSSQVEYFPMRTELPEGATDKDKWILVDLSRQTLEAYEGHMPVFVTLISSGLPESEETVTPTGTFHITFKHVTDNMAGSIGDGDEVYSVADVPWVQYIHRNIALHASFWHSRYGRPKSHGCINLAPADARFLFDWTTPVMPEGWHGTSSTDTNPGTIVIIQGKTPK